MVDPISKLSSIAVLPRKFDPRDRTMSKLSIQSSASIMTSNTPLLKHHGAHPKLGTQKLMHENKLEPTNKHDLVDLEALGQSINQPMDKQDSIGPRQRGKSLLPSSQASKSLTMDRCE